MSLHTTKKILQQLQKGSPGMSKPNMSKRDYNKLSGKHSDITQKEKPPTLKQRVKILEKELEQLKKDIALVKPQSAKAYAMSFQATNQLAAISEGKDADSK